MHKVEAIRREQQEALQPYIDGLHAEVRALQSELTATLDRLETSEREAVEARAKLEGLERTVRHGEPAGASRRGGLVVGVEIQVDFAAAIELLGLQ